MKNYKTHAAMDIDEYRILSRAFGYNLGYNSSKEFHEGVIFFKVDLDTDRIFFVDYVADPKMSDEKWDGLDYSFFINDLKRRNIIADDETCNAFFDLEEIKNGEKQGNVFFEQKYTTMENGKSTTRLGMFEIKNDDKKRIALFAIVDINQYETKLHQMTAHAENDYLTGLTNRRGLDRIMEEYLDASKDRNFAMIIIDIDDFKRVNDLYGHGIGDDILITLANNMKDVFGKNAVIARMGGDEFMIVIKDTKKEEALVLIDKMSKMKHQFNKFGKMVEFTISMGVSFYPETSGEYSALARQADLALYSAKLKGKNNYLVYSNVMDRISRTSSQLLIRPYTKPNRSKMASPSKPVKNYNMTNQ